MEHLRRALADAASFERDELRRVAALPHAARVELGVSWPIARVDLVSPDRRRTSLLTLRPRAGADLHDGIEPGERVEVAVGGQKLDGEVVDADGGWAEIRVHGDIDVQGDAIVTKVFDPTPWTRLAEALEKADAHRSDLRDVLLGRRPPSPLLSTTPNVGGVPRGAKERATSNLFSLDPGQIEAASVVLRSGEVALVHGPPGTGKTTLLVSLLLSVVADGDRPWALADSNAAVDHLAGRAAAAGLDVVRVGPPGRMGEEGRRLSLRERIRTGPFAPALNRLERDILRLDPHQDREALAELQLQARNLREQAEDAALQSAQVIASTLGTLLRRAAHLPPARHAFVDEATQAIEPLIWAAIPYIQHLTLLGDPHQLGPVVRRPGSPLGISLVERLLNPTAPGRSPTPMPMLQVQRRMNTEIQSLLADVYPPAWVAAAEVADHRLQELPGVLPSPLTARTLLFVDTAGAGLDEEMDPTTKSWRNPGEAALVAAVVQQLRDLQVHPSLIGVLTPYSAQARLLKEAPELDGVEVASINAFQGREREVVICTWVRSNHDGELGFVADGRRLTVALSRARRLLVQVGDSATLAESPRFAYVLQRLAERDAVESVWDAPWDQIVATLSA